MKHSFIVTLCLLLFLPFGLLAQEVEMRIEQRTPLHNEYPYAQGTGYLEQNEVVVVYSFDKSNLIAYVFNDRHCGYIEVSKASAKFLKSNNVPYLQKKPNAFRAKESEVKARIDRFYYVQDSIARREAFVRDSIARREAFLRDSLQHEEARRAEAKRRQDSTLRVAQYEAAYSQWLEDSAQAVTRDSLRYKYEVDTLGWPLLFPITINGSITGYASPNSLYPSETLYDLDCSLYAIGHEGDCWVCAYLGKTVYVKRRDVTMLNTPTTYFKQSSTRYKNFVPIVSAYQSHQELLALLKQATDFYERAKQQGAAVDWTCYDESEYTDGTSFKFEFTNLAKKRVKYVNIAFRGYNAVDDPVGGVISKQCVGPIEPDESATYRFEYAWFTDVVEYAKITSLRVQYMDGSVKTFNADKLKLPTDVWLYDHYSLDKFGGIMDYIENHSYEVTTERPAWLDRKAEVVAGSLAIPTEQATSAPTPSSDPTDSRSNEAAATDVAVPAQFPGGEAALGNYLAKNLKYPQTALEQRLQGTAILRFVVEKDGSVGDVSVVRSLSKECDAEAIRVLKSLPRFAPAKNTKGEAVRQKLTVPIRFTLQ